MLLRNNDTIIGDSDKVLPCYPFELIVNGGLNPWIYWLPIDAFDNDFSGLTAIVMLKLFTVRRDDKILMTAFPTGLNDGATYAFRGFILYQI